MSEYDDFSDEDNELCAVLVVGRAYDLSEKPESFVEELTRAAEQYGESVALPLTALMTGVPLEDGSMCGVLVAGLVIAYAIDTEGPTRVEAERFRTHSLGDIPQGFWGALAAQGACFDGADVVEGTFAVPIGWSVARLLETPDETVAGVFVTSVHTAPALRLPPEFEGRLADERETMFLDVHHA